MMKFVIIFLLIFSGNVGWSQKRALDTAAYKLWRRVDAPNISEDGKWVTYHSYILTQNMIHYLG